MKKIPPSENSLALRTDFSDENAWREICAAIQEPSGDLGFTAYVDFVSDPEYDGLGAEQLPSVISEGSHRTFAFIIDHLALSQPDHPILVVDLSDEPGRTLRVIPSELWSIENNLSIGNMDFSEFADAAGSDGVFRDFA
jgi:hypothetical protein